MELGWSYPKRKKYLDDVSKKSTGKTQSEYFQNANQDFAVHVIPIELPKYRIDNGRTYAAQAQYLANKKLSSDFFEKDAESDVVQQAQHEILKGMMKDKGLFDYFKTHEQSNAIILSHEGYVINGNRRLCTWRELFYSGKYPKFSHLRAIILPPADQKDIDEMEARLQVHQDIKADYTWTSTALMLRNRKAAYNYSIGLLAKLFEMSEGDVEELLDMLTYAETYLEDRNKLGQYNLVDRAEYAFRQLHKRRGRIKEEPYKDVFERLAFCLIDASEREGRLYQSIPDLADHLGKVVQKLQEDFKIRDSTPSEGAELLGGSSYTPVAGVIDVLNNEKNYEQVTQVALDVIEAEKEKNKEKKERNFVHAQVKKANTALLEAVSAIDSKTTKDGIAAQITSIEDSIKKLKEWLNNAGSN